MTDKSVPFLILLLAGLAGGCASTPGSMSNQSLDSVRQPVVATGNYSIGLRLTGDDLAPGEAERLTGWLHSISAGGSDRYAVEGVAPSSAAHGSIAAIAAATRITQADGYAPLPSPVVPGNVRMVLLRNRAYVPGCPDWGAKSQGSIANATSPGYGCAVNSNLAAMVADPEDLVRGVPAERSTTHQTLRAIRGKIEGKPAKSVDAVQGSSGDSGGGSMGSDSGKGGGR